MGFGLKMLQNRCIACMCPYIVHFSRAHLYKPALTHSLLFFNSGKYWHVLQLTGRKWNHFHPILLINIGEKERARIVCVWLTSYLPSLLLPGIIYTSAGILSRSLHLVECDKRKNERESGRKVGIILYERNYQRLPLA